MKELELPRFLRSVDTRDSREVCDLSSRFSALEPVQYHQSRLNYKKHT